MLKKRSRRNNSLSDSDMGSDFDSDSNQEIKPSAQKKMKFEKGKVGKKDKSVKEAKEASICLLILLI